MMNKGEKILTYLIVGGIAYILIASAGKGYQQAPEPVQSQPDITEC